MKVLFAGGGTGGHLLPVRNLAEWLARDSDRHEVRFLTSGRKVEDYFFGERGTWTRIPLFEGYKSRPSLFKPFVWRQAVKRVRAEIRSFDPDALVISGGYVSLPVVVASWFSGRPLYVLEQNALPGKTARFAARFARRVFCHFETAGEVFKNKAMVTGSPLAPEFDSQRRERVDEVRKEFGLKGGMPTLLVAGGSQGARAINDLVLKCLPPMFDLWKGRIQILHITGPNDFERVEAVYDSHRIPVKVLPFMDPMERAYKAADLIFCRGGGMTIAEITAIGLPAVVVPYPHHRDQHQLHNCEEMIEADGAVLFEENTFSGRTFRDKVLNLLLDGERLKRMSMNARGVGRLSGSRRIMETMMRDTEVAKRKDDDEELDLIRI